MVLASPLDQAVSLGEHRGILDQIDVVIEEAVDRGDHRIIMRMLYGFQGLGQAVGLAKAKALYEGQRHWALFPIDESYTFVDACLAEAGISHETVRKYVPIWEHVVQNPMLSDAQREVILTKPIVALDLLTAAAREGEITDEDWDEIILAPDKATIRELVRKIRGHVGPSQTAVVITYNTKDGTVRARRGDILTPVGSLPQTIPGLSDEQEEIKNISQERIIRACGMVVQQ